MTFSFGGGGRDLFYAGFEQVSLGSFTEDGKWLCFPDIGQLFIPALRVRTEKSRDFAEQPLFALSYGGTSRPADVVEQSALTGTCGLTSVFR